MGCELDGFPIVPRHILSCVCLTSGKPSIFKALKNSDYLCWDNEEPTGFLLSSIWKVRCFYKCCYGSATRAIVIWFVWGLLSWVCMTISYYIMTIPLITVTTWIHCTTSEIFFVSLAFIQTCTMTPCFNMCLEPTPILLGISLNCMKMMPL